MTNEPREEKAHMTYEQRVAAAFEVWMAELAERYPGGDDDDDEQPAS